MHDLGKLFDESSLELRRFLKRVGKIWLYEELAFLGIEQEWPSGMFGPKRVHMLLEFCAKEPAYHIISCNNYKIYNKYLPDANSYYLADGDTDVSLVLDLLGGLSVDEFLQVGYAKFAPIF